MRPQAAGSRKVEGARSDMIASVGRSRLEVLAPGVPAPAILQAAAGFGAQHQFVQFAGPPNVVDLAKRRSLVNGTPRIVVSAWDLPQGAHVRVEAWIDAGGITGDINVDPRAIYGALPRRKFWKVVVELLLALGVSGAADQFHHL